MGAYPKHRAQAVKLTSKISVRVSLFMLGTLGLVCRKNHTGLARRTRGVSRPSHGRLIFKTENADFIQQGFVGDAEFFGGPGFVPFGVTQGVLYLEALHVLHGAL